MSTAAWLDAFFNPTDTRTPAQRRRDELLQLAGVFWVIVIIAGTVGLWLYGLICLFKAVFG